MEIKRLNLRDIKIWPLPVRDPAVCTDLPILSIFTAAAPEGREEEIRHRRGDAVKRQRGTACSLLGSENRCCSSNPGS